MQFLYYVHLLAQRIEIVSNANVTKDFAPAPRYFKFHANAYY
jgi:hypothetical protein